MLVQVAYLRLLHLENRLFGILLVALAGVFFATGGLFMQFAGPDASIWVAAFVGLLVGGIIVVPVALVRLGGLGAMTSQHRWMLIARGLISFAQISTLRKRLLDTLLITVA